MDRKRSRTKSKDTKSERSSKSVSEKPKTKSVRTPSGYLLFSSDYRNKRKEKLTLGEIGKVWKKCSDKEKKKWNDKAEKLKEEILEEEDMKSDTKSRKSAKSKREKSEKGKKDKMAIKANKAKKAKRGPSQGSPGNALPSRMGAGIW